MRSGPAGRMTSDGPPSQEDVIPTPNRFRRTIRSRPFFFNGPSARRPVPIRHSIINTPSRSGYASLSVTIPSRYFSRSANYEALNGPV